MFQFGVIPNPNNGTGQFQFGSSESGGKSLGGPVVDERRRGRRRDTPFSESKADRHVFKTNHHCHNGKKHNNQPLWARL